MSANKPKLTFVPAPAAKRMLAALASPRIFGRPRILNVPIQAVLERAVSNGSVFDLGYLPDAALSRFTQHSHQLLCDGRIQHPTARGRAPWVFTHKWDHDGDRVMSAYLVIPTDPGGPDRYRVFEMVLIHTVDESPSPVPHATGDWLFGHTLVSIDEHGIGHAHKMDSSVVTTGGPDTEQIIQNCRSSVNAALLMFYSRRIKVQGIEAKTLRDKAVRPNGARFHYADEDPVAALEDALESARQTPRITPKSEPEDGQ